MGHESAHGPADVLHQSVRAARSADSCEHGRRVRGRPPRYVRIGEAGEHPPAQQILLLLPVSQGETRKVVGGVPLREVSQRPWLAARITDRCGVRDQLLELTRLVSRLLLVGELREDALPGGRIGGDDAIAGFADAGCVDPCAVLELRERLLAVPTGHDWLPPHGTQRDALLRMAAVGNFVPEIVPGERWHVRKPLYHKANLVWGTLSP